MVVAVTVGPKMATVAATLVCAGSPRPVNHRVLPLTAVIRPNAQLL